MKLLPVALALFYRIPSPGVLDVWTQVRTDDGPYHGMLEFPGGGIEIDEHPIDAVVREVAEEVGIEIRREDGKAMGVFPNELPTKTVLLYVFTFPAPPELEGKGEWLRIEKQRLSEVYKGKIPGPNHQMIDELFRSLYDDGHE